MPSLLGRATVPTSGDFWRAVLWLIVLASLGGYVMYVYVARTQGATVVSTLLYLTPPTTMLWVYLMFGAPADARRGGRPGGQRRRRGLVLRGRRVREPVRCVRSQA